LSPRIESVRRTLANMAYDEGLAERVREVLRESRIAATEKKMFGGVAWLFGGAMGVGIVKEELMVRVGPAAHDDALARPHARTMDFTGKPMRGYVFVKPAGFAADKDLERWVREGALFAKSLSDEKLAPSKPPRARRAK
jgi:TfoX/Sxy family transcriptional regulator of competence genes